MKKLSILLLVAFSFIFAASAFAGGKGGDKKGAGDLDEKFYKMSGMIAKNAEEFGMNEEQKEAVIEKKYALKKDIVTKQAEIDLICLDVSRELWKDTVDAGKIDVLVDKKYQLKAEKTKAVVNAYAALKNSLTPEQKETLKSLCEKKCTMSGKSEGKMDMPKRGKKK